MTLFYWKFSDLLACNLTLSCFSRMLVNVQTKQPRYTNNKYATGNSRRIEIFQVVLRLKRPNYNS